MILASASLSGVLQKMEMAMRKYVPSKALDELTCLWRVPSRARSGRRFLHLETAESPLISCHAPRSLPPSPFLPSLCWFLRCVAPSVVALLCACVSVLEVVISLAFQSRSTTAE